MKKKNKKRKIKKENSKTIENFNSEENSYFDIFREGLLLWIIYMILSQNIVKNIFGLLIDALNPNDNGVYDVYGVSIYGIILVILFLVFKHIFIYN